ncbi:hypothetical protein BO85DRAFT_491837 [Aspergillus piperis CBS 112811]|uniref:DUF676 domain-containing protein n=1 Tax=Aspergillus piperis CBS 112811 TaxID=1448313 RepID=A0A8G1QTS6_9EURO|nr:hypothetical protein BO85DRAFT_491837 [Aspergillus piperis CBS 112811]RAH53713.1 hypothetical protein BO85DRAFT_491837 [Aspergillus piperis CBS 112811]
MSKVLNFFVGGRQRKDQDSSSRVDPPNLSQSSAQASFPLEFPDGVEVLHDCPNATVDICFIHGLSGDRTTTWTAQNQSDPWPKTLLPSELTTARILTYGYDAYVVRRSVAGSNRLVDHAINLLNDLTMDRDDHNAASRPIIFVAHSLGGLVCKKAILSSRNNPDIHLQNVFKYTAGVIFMGTPHQGSWMAKWATIPATALGLVKSTNKLLLDILQTDNQFLQSIQNDFLSMIRELQGNGRSLRVTCFFEELSLSGYGQVVSRNSATFDGFKAISIHADHCNMVRFSSAKNTGFTRLAGELKRWEKEVRPLPEPADRLASCLSTCERQAKRGCDSLDETISKRRRTASRNSLQERDYSDNTDYDGSSIFDGIDSTEDTAVQPSQESCNGDNSESEDLEEDTSDEPSRSSDDTEAHNESLTDDLAPFSQNTAHSEEDSGDETDW